MTLTEQAEGKVVLLTGSTGFLGSVILEKILWSLPNVKKLILFVRGKKGESKESRFIKNIKTKPCFERLREKHGKNIENFINSKVQLIEADLLTSNLGLTKESEEIIINEADIFICVAASVDFRAELLVNINVNLYGTLRLFELAKKVKHLANFVQISTCYVNSDKSGYIQEKIYDYDDDPEATIQKIMKMSPDVVKQQTLQILGKFENTYVYSKNYCERILQKNRPKGFTLTIVRPSIIGCAYKDPFPGWTETVTASNAFFLFVGIGMIRYVNGPCSNIGDIVPVDCCADQIIAGSFLLQNTDQVHVINSGTSGRNPFTWKFSEPIINQYFNQHPPQRKFASSHAYFLENKCLFDILNMLRKAPAVIFQYISKWTGDKQMISDGARWVKMVEKGKEIAELFSRFTQIEFIFESKKVDQLMEMMSESERKNFTLDVSVFSQYEYMLIYSWGLQRYILEEKVEPPTVSDLLLKKNTSFFSDIQWAITSGKFVSCKPSSQYVCSVLESSNVRNAIAKQVDARMKKAAKSTAASKNSGSDTSSSQIKSQLESKAKDICEEIVADFQMPVLRTVSWIFHQFFKQIYSKLIVDKKTMEKIAKHSLECDGPLIFVPTHKSYIDFMIVCYILFSYHIQSPHIAVDEIFKNVSLIGHFLRLIGAFFVKKDDSEPIYNAVLNEYIIQLLENKCSLQIFLEEKRSSNQKIQNKPKVSMLTSILEAIQKNRIRNATIIPITISYDKVVETETLPDDLLEENPAKKNLTKLLSSIVACTQKFGRVNVQLSDPIKLNEYIAQHKSASLKDQAAILANQILCKQQEKQTIMPTHIVSSLILMNRKGLFEQTLISKMQWVQSLISKRKGQFGYAVKHCNPKTTVASAIKLLQSSVQSSLKSIFEQHILPKENLQSHLILNYYRNGLIHVFFNEALVTCALCSLNNENEVTEEKLFKQFEFIQNLLCQEQISKTGKSLSMQEFQELIKKMIGYQVIKIDEGKIHILDQDQVSFLNSLVWPIIESYWIVAQFLYTLHKNSTTKISKNIEYKIQCFALDLYKEKLIEFLEACSKQTFRNVLETLHSVKYIEFQKNTSNKCEDDNSSLKLLGDMSQLTTLLERLSLFLRKNQIQTTSSLDQISKTSLFGEFKSTQSSRL